MGTRALSTSAHRPVEIIRRTVDELAELDSGEAARSASVDYREFVSAHADELGDWLRADDGHARSFAEETRQSASRIEEAIIRWGPTLVEDPESAELLNLLPDIVDSALSASQAVAPAAVVGGWTDSDRQLFKDGLLDILKNVDEFDRRLSP